MSEKITGGCLCGAVRYESSEAPKIVVNCHCLDCRKTSGTCHGTHVGLAKESFTVSGEVRFYDSTADSGNIASRGFCPICGSPVYSKNSAMADMIAVRASSLDDPEIAKPQLAVYASRAVSWDPVDPNCEAFPEMPNMPA